MENQIQNPDGLHRKYRIQKVRLIAGFDFFGNTKYREEFTAVEKGSEYFVLRLDENAGDIEHLRACRIAIRAYALAISHRIPKLADDLLEKYPLI